MLIVVAVAPVCTRFAGTVGFVVSPAVTISGADTPLLLPAASVASMV